MNARPTLIGDRVAGRLTGRAIVRLGAGAETMQRRVLGAYLRLRGVPRVFSYTTAEERIALYQLARRVPDGGRALEIGTHLGGTACYLAAGLGRRGGRLTCVDTWRGERIPDHEPRDVYDEFLRNTAAFADRISVIRKRSDDVTPEDVPDPFDLVFIDGDHGYEQVRRDVDRFAPRLAGGGVLAFHDGNQHVGVSRTVGELLAGGEWVLKGAVNSLFWMIRPRWRDDGRRDDG